MALQTRQPTGAVPWPLLLIEGEEKSGKTWSCAEFTASARVGRCFWIDLGEGAADEYGAIPGASYEVVEHDGSFAALYANVAEIHALAAQALARGDKPVVLIIDTMTSEWDLLKDWATDRAKSSKSNRAKLERDPNAEVTVSGNYWNDANVRHRKLMRLLKTFPGIALMTANGKPVAVIGPDGQPVEGQKTHKVEAQKTLGADASCWLRLYREQPGIIVGGRSVHLKFRPGDKPKLLADDWTLEAVIFDVLKCDPATARARDLTEPKADAVTPEQIRDEALHPGTGLGRIRELYAEAKRVGYDDVTLMNEIGDDELLLAILIRVGNERKDGEPGGTHAASARNGSRATPGDDPWYMPAAPDGVPEAEVDEAWLAEAVERAGALPGRDAATALWEEAGAKLRDGQIAKADADGIAAIIRERVGELSGAPA